MNIQQNLFPLMIDLSDKKIIIIGGGNVAERKADLFLDYAAVTVINVNFIATLEERQSNPRLELIYTNPEHLSDQELMDIFSDAFLVIPATADSSLNNRFASLAKQCGILTNQVDTVGEVVIPSVIKQGDLTIGISTNGSSPALSKFTRTKIEQLITPQYADMARLQCEIREYCKQQIIEQDKRKQILWDILNNNDIWQALSESYDQALKIAYQSVNSS